MSLNVIAKELMLGFLSGMKEYLKNQSELEIESITAINPMSKLMFKKVTSFIPVNNEINMHFVLSLDEEMLNHISAAYLDMGEDEITADDCIEMAGELNNIVLGLSMTNMKDKSLFSPPNIVLNKENIEKKSDTEIYGSTIETSKGILNIYFMGPIDSFNHKLEYIGESV